jgi:hypothetical protein
MKYFKSQEIEDFKKLGELLNPIKFLKDMKKLGELDEITKNYSYDCCQLCHNAIAWGLKQLKDTLYFYEIEVCYGKVGYGEHSWFKLGDYYIDLTLAQFVRTAPKLAITLIKDNDVYKPSFIVSSSEWIKTEMEN